MILSNLEVQVWVQNVFLLLPPSPGAEVGFCCCFLQWGCICFHNSALGVPGFIALPPEVLGEGGEKDPDGALCCSQGGCWCLLRPTLTGRTHSPDSHPTLSCRFVSTTSARETDQCIYEFLYLWFLKALFYPTSPHSTFSNLYFRLFFFYWCPVALTSGKQVSRPVFPKISATSALSWIKEK